MPVCNDHPSFKCPECGNIGCQWSVEEIYQHYPCINVGFACHLYIGPPYVEVECRACHKMMKPSALISTKDLCSICGGRLEEVDCSRREAPDGKDFRGNDYPSGYYEVEEICFKKCKDCGHRFGPFQVSYLEGT